MRFFLLLFLLMPFASSQAQEDPRLYLRGAFNGWGTSDPFRAAEAGIYISELRIGPGYHGFKLGSQDWAKEWVIDPVQSVRIEIGRDYALAQRGGAQDFLLVPNAAGYRFILDVRTTQPSLRVERVVEDAMAKLDIEAAHGSNVVTTLAFATHDGAQVQAKFSQQESAGEGNAGLRDYVHTSEAPQRDPRAPIARYAESADQPRLRSGSVAFDALFALAVSEMRQNAVQQIREASYNGGNPIACDCFETGEQWTYVWTRDLAYAAHLGLAMLDPQRVKNGLLFKLSGWREGMRKPAAAAGSTDGLQIVQDTGSGGSWPVSTDRVSWAFGAAAALDYLPPAEAREFALSAFQALRNTLENDRLVAWDARDGLYGGEQSFLDWREQSYAPWVSDDLASMASAKALSTNVAHYRALRLAQDLAEQIARRLATEFLTNLFPWHATPAHARRELHRLAQRYRSWADALKRAINVYFWQPQIGLYASLRAGHFDGAAMPTYDWLGQTLAITTGVASKAQAQQILASYPHGPYGPPVIYPQLPDVPVYHNRSLWPFVTAMGLEAAVKAQHAPAADAAIASLVRGAALHLSNMENLEWLSGQAMWLDEARPELSGPVINSRRQLWSVGAYVGMVIQQIFGVAADARGVRFAPFVTPALQRDFLAGSREMRLLNLSLHGRRLTINLHLPTASSASPFRLARVQLNGRITTAQIPWQAIEDGSVIDLYLEPGRERAVPSLRRVSGMSKDSATADLHTAPAVPQLVQTASGALMIVDEKNAAVTSYVLRRAGKVIRSNLSAGELKFALAPGCYVVQAVQPASSAERLRSQHSQPLCIGVKHFIALDDPRIVTQRALQPPDAQHDKAWLADWGQPDETLTLNRLDFAQSGPVHIQLRYRNTANEINLGITCAVKWMTVKDARGHQVAQGPIVMPHARGAAWSTPLSVDLPAGRYSVHLQDHFNMSALTSNASYRHRSGEGGVVNRVDLLGVAVRGSKKR